MRVVLAYAAVLALLFIPLNADATGIELMAGDTALSHLPAPYFADAKMMVPVDVLRYLGGELLTLSQTESSFIVADQTVMVKVGSDQVKVNNALKNMDVPAQARNGTVFIPLRLLCEELRLCDVEWLQANSIIRLQPRLPTQRVNPALTTIQPSVMRPEVADSNIVAVNSKTTPNQPVIPPTPMPVVHNEQQQTTQVAESKTPITPPALSPSVLMPTQSTILAQETATTNSTVSPAKPTQEATQRLAWEWPGENGHKLQAEATSSAGDFVLNLKGVSIKQVEATCTSVPAKIIVDIADFVVSSQFLPELFAHPMVNRVRLANYKGKARLVFDLTQLVGYQIEPEENGIIIRLNRALQHFSVTTTQAGGQLDIDLPANTPYHIIRLIQPDRVVIDLMQTTLLGGSQTYILDKGPLHSLRASQFNSQVTRLVLDVDTSYQSTPYKLDKDKLAFLLHSEVEQVGLVRLENNVNAVYIQGRGYFKGNVMQQHNPEKLILDLVDTQSNFTFINQVITDSPVSRIQAEQFAPGVFRVVMDLAGKTNYRLLELPDGGGLAILFTPLAVKGARIALDAGHGGIDPGASGPGGLQEKEVNLDIIRRLSELLTSSGAQIFATRTSDIYIDLSTRRTLLNSYNPDIIVSIHANATLDHNSKASGTETWYMNDNDRNYAITIQSELVATIGTLNRGVKQGQYAVLRDACAPAILVEVAFVSQEADELLLRDADFRQKVAQGLYRGIAKWLEPSATDVSAKLAGEPHQLWAMLMQSSARNQLITEKKASADNDIVPTRLVSGGYEVSLASISVE